MSNRKKTSMEKALKSKAVKGSSETNNIFEHLENIFIFVFFSSIFWALFIRYVELGYLNFSTIKEMPDKMLMFSVIFLIVTTGITLLLKKIKKLKDIFYFPAFTLFLMLYCFFNYITKYSLKDFFVHYIIVLFYFVASSAYLGVKYYSLRRQKVH